MRLDENFLEVGVWDSLIHTEWADRAVMNEKQERLMSDWIIVVLL